MISLLLVLALGQSSPSKADIIGSLNTAASAIQQARAGTRTVTRNTAKTRICIAPATSIAPGAKTIRYGSIVMSAAFQNIAGFTGTATQEAYGAMEIQYDPESAVTSKITFKRLVLLNNIDILESEIEARESPFNAACEVGILRADDTAWGNLVKCGCAATPSTCTWDPDGAGTLFAAQTPAPTGVTFAHGTFTGAGCKAKPCLTRYDGIGLDRSWPASCPK
jgi:hypothetical protein